MANDLSVSGLISGLDTKSLIDRMMAMENRSINSIRAKKQAREDKANAVKDVRTRLAALASTISALTRISALNIKKISTDTPATTAPFVSASANSLAANGNFQIRVDKLATATSVGSASNIGKTWVDEGVSLSNAGFAIAPSSGKFTINGKAIEISSEDKIGDVVTKINAAGANVTASLVVDGGGKAVRLSLTSVDPIRLGSAADTSNFLAATKLLTVVPATTMTSSADIGGVQANAKLTDSRLSTDVNLVAASFKINGIEINYDPTVDSLNNVVNRINASGANVTAAFDATSGKLAVTSKVTGGAAINLEDIGGGNFLAATGVLGAVQNYGLNAEYSINGGAVQTSATNTVADAVTGVSISLLRADPATTVNVTVSQDTSAAVKTIKSFVDQYNSTMSFVREQTAYDPLTKQAGTLLGDSTVTGLESMLTTIVNGPGVGLGEPYTNLASVGLTTGAIGSAAGTTRQLTVDEGKLANALTSNPDAVAAVFASFTNSASLNVGGTGSIASMTGSPIDHHSAGTYKIASDANGNLLVSFSPENGVEQAALKGSISAGSTNNTIIPGVTLTAKGGLVEGTDYITVLVQSKGVGVRIDDYLKNLVSSSGSFAARQKSSDKQISDLAKQIARMEDRLQGKEDALVKKFAALESAMAKYQSQSAALSSQLANLG